MSLPINQIINGDCLEVMKGFPDNSIDLLVTDPPYGISFMGKDWDRSIPSVEIWKQCLRVLKPGSFAFIMSISRQDCLSRMIVNLEDAGFNTEFTSIYWAYATGFPKAMNIGKAVDKKLGVTPEVVGKKTIDIGIQSGSIHSGRNNKLVEIDDTVVTSPQGKALNGSYAGFQPKPAVEIIIVAMKPLSEKTYVEQALKNGKGVTWLDDCRIPYQSNDDLEQRKRGILSSPPRGRNGIYGNDKNDGLIDTDKYLNDKGRFPANLLVSDDVLNDGKVLKSGIYVPSRDKLNRSGFPSDHNGYWDEGNRIKAPIYPNYGDEGSFSRYFDLDRWWDERVKQLPKDAQKTFPFLIVPKASSSERNDGCKELPTVLKPSNMRTKNGTGVRSVEIGFPDTQVKNFHPTVKPIKLISYLITLSSRENDIILDPFLGSGTTVLACQIMSRRWIGIEINTDYYNIACKRVEPFTVQTRLDYTVEVVR